MRYLSIFTPAPSEANVPPSPEKMAEMEKLVEESIRSGEVIMTGGMLPISRGGAQVRSERGKVTVVDGPFAESKEMIVGWAIMQADSREQAIEHTKKFLKVAGDGQCEFRQLMDEPEGNCG
ncbi:MAG TPA: YciI family protein [Isosphaeraceae bacterium]|jgi:hypothetical protein